MLNSAVDVKEDGFVRHTAVIGLGDLGLAVAERLAATGLSPPLVLDRDPDRARRLAEQHHCRSIEDLAGTLAEAGVVWVLVPDDEAAREVVAGLLKHLDRDALVLLSSTVGPRTACELAEQCAGRGIDFVEAPVSGGADAARAGELLILLGGADDAVDRARAAVVAEPPTRRPARSAPPRWSSCAISMFSSPDSLPSTRRSSWPVGPTWPRMSC